MGRSGSCIALLNVHVLRINRICSDQSKTKTEHFKEVLNRPSPNEIADIQESAEDLDLNTN